MEVLKEHGQRKFYKTTAKTLAYSERCVSRAMGSCFAQWSIDTSEPHFPIAPILPHNHSTQHNSLFVWEEGEGEMSTAHALSASAYVRHPVLWMSAGHQLCTPASLVQPGIKKTGSSKTAIQCGRWGVVSGNLQVRGRMKTEDNTRRSVHVTGLGYAQCSIYHSQDRVPSAITLGNG